MFVPVWLEVVSSGISDDSLEDDFWQGGFVALYSVSQDLQAWQNCVTEIPRFHGKWLQEQGHWIWVFQNTHL